MCAKYCPRHGSHSVIGMRAGVPRAKRGALDMGRDDAPMGSTRPVLAPIYIFRRSAASVTARRTGATRARIRVLLDSDLAALYGLNGSVAVVRAL